MAKMRTRQRAGSDGRSARAQELKSRDEGRRRIEDVLPEDLGEAAVSGVEDERPGKTDRRRPGAFIMFRSISCPPARSWDKNVRR